MEQDTAAYVVQLLCILCVDNLPSGVGRSLCGGVHEGPASVVCVTIMALLYRHTAIPLSYRHRLSLAHTLHTHTHTHTHACTHTQHTHMHTLFLSHSSVLGLTPPPTFVKVIEGRATESDTGRTAAARARRPGRSPSPSSRSGRGCSPI